MDHESDNPARRVAAATAAPCPSQRVAEMADGVLIVGHGTRDEQGLAELAELAAKLRARIGDMPVEVCCLELAAPDIGQGMARTYAAGARRVIVLPLLLFAAGHAKRDIPRAVAAAASRLPRLSYRVAEPLGCRPQLVELSLTRYRQALEGQPLVSAGDTLLVMVGRGSNDPQANAEMARFARLRWEAEPAGWLETCYLAMAEPSLERALAIAATMPFTRVVVQPHLLLAGQLLNRAGETVRRFAALEPGKRWLATEHLGPDDLIVDALCEEYATGLVDVGPFEAGGSGAKRNAARQGGGV